MESLHVSRYTGTECLYIHFMIFGIRSGLLIIPCFQRKCNYEGLKVFACLPPAAEVRWDPVSSPWARVHAPMCVSPYMWTVWRARIPATLSTGAIGSEWCGTEAVLQRGFRQDVLELLHFKSLN